MHFTRRWIHAGGIGNGPHRRAVDDVSNLKYSACRAFSQARSITHFTHFRVPKSTRHARLACVLSWQQMHTCVGKTFCAQSGTRLACLLDRQRPWRCHSTGMAPKGVAASNWTDAAKLAHGMTTIYLPEPAMTEAHCERTGPRQSVPSRRTDILPRSRTASGRGRARRCVAHVPEEARTSKGT